MRKLLSVLVSLILVFHSNANSVDSLLAKKIAETFLRNNLNQTNIDLQLIQESYASVTINNIITQKPLYYIFNNGVENGFIIISAEDNAIPILGHSTSGTINLNNLPPAFAKWLEGYKKELIYIIENDIQATLEIKEKWQKLSNNGTLGDSKAPSVLPLLNTTWGQSPNQNYPYAFYNDQCPDSSNQLALTGCVATAMAQIMNYWEFPAQGSLWNNYYSSFAGSNIGANFGQTVYQWSSMPNSLTSSSSNTAVSAVAKLMYHCGVSVEMNYGTAGSGIAPSHLWKVDTAFSKYFNYSNSTELVKQTQYTASAWIQLLKDELDDGRPIFYVGNGTGGHAFVCDGYDNNNHFSFNWGWHGNADGNFPIGGLNPGTYNFSNYNEAVVGIKPPAGSTTYNMELYSSVIPSSNIIGYGASFSITTNFKNNGPSIFNGDYTAAIFDNSGNFIDYVEIKYGYSLSVNNVYVNNQVFSTSGLLNVLPGTYDIQMFYRPTGGNWQAFSSGNYQNLTQITIVNSNDIELNSSLIANPTTFIQGQSASVNFNIVNNGSTTFHGLYDISLYNIGDGSLVENIGQFNTSTNGLQAGYTYLPPYLTLNTSSITASPGTYLLAVMHQENGGQWELTGSSFYQNPIYVTVLAPPLIADIYESNNTLLNAYPLPVSFTGNNSTIITTGSNHHTGLDHDYYSIYLPSGYNYTITARAHDSDNSGNGQTYTNDVAWLYSTNSGNTWSTTYDDIMSSSINIANGGMVNFKVMPYFPGNTGTYLFDLQISRTLIPPLISNGVNMLDPSCYGGSDGSIDITFSGGTFPYTYAWSGPNGFTSSQEDIYNLPEGTYYVIVTDINNMQITWSYILNSPPPLNVSILQNNNVLTLFVNGGSPGYTYSWREQSQPSFNLGSGMSYSANTNGTYYVIVTDINGCGMTSNSIVYTQPTLINEHTSNKKLLKINNLLGQETPYKTNTPLIEIYNDGTVEKKLIIE
tara:strand:- start:359 stop:3283 length:2925 start_codon:yes stop_codon:yes gene_type:complete